MTGSAWLWLSPAASWANAAVTTLIEPGACRSSSGCNSQAVADGCGASTPSATRVCPSDCLRVIVEAVEQGD